MNAGLQTKTFKVSMWMRKFKSYTWKRTWLWSTSEEIRHLDLGPMTPEERETGITTVDRQERNGRSCWTANENLKQTQPLIGTLVKVVYLVIQVGVH